MRLAAFRVFVDDLEAARAFYADVLELPVKWEADGVAIGLDAGIDLIVELVGDDADQDDRAMVGRFSGCSFAVADIEAAHASLAGRGVTFTGPPRRQFWGGVLAHFSDPAGNVLTLVGR